MLHWSVASALSFGKGHTSYDCHKAVFLLTMANVIHEKVSNVASLLQVFHFIN